MANPFSLLNRAGRLGTGPRLLGRRGDCGRSFRLRFPLYLSDFAAYNVSYYLLNIPMALGLCLLWGYCGVLSFRPSLPIPGIAGYTYGVIAGTVVGHSWGPMLGSLGGLVMAAIVAAVFGYFVFFARVQIWILPILTLVLTLLLEDLPRTDRRLPVGESASCSSAATTALTGIPAFQIGDFMFSGYSFFYLALGLALVCYLACRMARELRGTEKWHARHPRRRAAHRDARLRHPRAATMKLVFVLAALLAALSGLLYVQWGNYITPSQVGLLSAALPTSSGWRWAGVEKLLCGRHRYVCAQLVELQALLIRQPIRSRHHWRIACHRHGVFPERFGRQPGRSGWTPFEAVRGVDSSSSRVVAGMTEAILSIDGLKKQFGDVVATDNVTLDVAAGGLQRIIGPNGAGKSTFFALLCGLHELDGGGDRLQGEGHHPDAALLAGSGRGWGSPFRPTAYSAV